MSRPSNLVDLPTPMVGAIPSKIMGGGWKNGTGGLGRASGKLELRGGWPRKLAGEKGVPKIETEWGRGSNFCSAPHGFKWNSPNNILA